MLREDFIKKNPLRVLQPAPGKDFPEYRMGLVMARAGLGKTSILVQVAIDNIFRGQRVLHVGIGDGLEKAKAWYDDIFKYIIENYSLDNALEVGEVIMRNRMIMTFKESAFSRPKLEERLNDLIYQNIFRPDCIIVDGFDFVNRDREALEDLRELVKILQIQAWFSAVRHREDTRMGPQGVPAPCHEMGDLFETVILLEPQQEGIVLDIIKDATGCAELGKSLRLDPSTMMVKAV